MKTLFSLHFSSWRLYVRLLPAEIELYQQMYWPSDWNRWTATITSFKFWEHAHVENFRPPNLKRVLSTENSYLWSSSYCNLKFAIIYGSECNKHVHNKCSPRRQRFHIGFRSLDPQEMKKKEKGSTKSVTLSSREMRWKQTYKREGGVARRSWGRGY